ncbi:MAG: hypothetical protein ABR985_12755 [Methanotrichaceae archaeon]
MKLINFQQKYLFTYIVIAYYAGVLERIGWPQKLLVVVHSTSAPKVDLRVLELQAAKEVLAEVFRVRISDVEEMIQNRYEEFCYVKPGYEETEPWPREFMLE